MLSKRWFSLAVVLLFCRYIIVKGVFVRNLTKESPGQIQLPNNVHQLCDETISCSSCGKLTVTFSLLGSSSHLNYFWELRNIYTGEISMSGGIMYNQVVTKCVENSSYNFTLKANQGAWITYQFYVNDLLFGEKDTYLSNRKDFFKQIIICSFDNECDDGDDCTEDLCNRETKQCFHNPIFSSVCRSFGKPSFLAIQVTSLDKQTPLSKDELSDYIFGSFGKEVTMRKQFRDCSFGNFDPTPFSGATTTGINIEKGVIKVSIPVNIVGEKVSSVVDQALSQSQQLLGNVESQFDFVLLCLPFGSVIGVSENWKAYAFVNGFLSVYNGDNCKYLSVLMHEIGHNLGLSHSNDEANYGDETGYQGISYSITEGPKKCFNAAKYWDLGWIKDKQEELDVQNDVHTTAYNFNYIFHGIVEKDQADAYPVIVKIVNFGDGFDYFLSYNRKVGMNAETGEGGDKVILVKREMGLSYRDSSLVAKLAFKSEIESFFIRNAEGVTFQISAGALEESSLPYVSISRQFDNSFCLNDNECVALDDCTISECKSSRCKTRPLSCDECGAQVQVNISTNEYPNDLVWKVQKYARNQVSIESGYYDFPDHTYSKSKCLPPGLYTFIVNYSNNDTHVKNYADFSLEVGDIVVDNGTLFEESYIESIFIICSEDVHCFDFDGCSIDYCNNETKTCENIFDDENENCVDCSWLQLNITFDNFPEETAWDLSNIDMNFTSIKNNVLSGEPYPFEFSRVFGRRKAPTKSGRRKAPTRAGRRKAPTKAGRRKAPTRSSSQIRNLFSTSIMDTRLLNDEEEDDKVAEAICLEHNLLYRFAITDTFGDGICCSEGEGSYIIQTENDVLVRGGNFEDREEISFAFTKCRDDADCNAISISYTGKCNPMLGLCLMLLKPCESYGEPVTLTLKTAQHPVYAKWEMRFGSKTILSYGPYDVSWAYYEYALCLPLGSYNLQLTNYDSKGIDKYELRVGNVVRARSPCKTVYSQFSSPYVIDSTFDVLSTCSSNLNNVTVLYKAGGSPEQVKWIIYRLPSYEEIINEPYGIEKYKTNAITRCVESGNYVLSFESIYSFGIGYRQGAFVQLFVNDEIVDQFLDLDSFHTKNISFFLCESDDECDDDSSCTLDICDPNTKLCKNEKLPCSECLPDFTPCNTTMDVCLVSCSECGKVNALIEITTSDWLMDYFSWFLTNSQTGEVLGTGEVNGWDSKPVHKYAYQYCLDIGVYKFYVENSQPFPITSGRYSFRVQDTIYQMGKLNLKPDSDPSEVYITVCNSDSQCDDGDGCTIDSCDLNQQLCVHEKLPCISCMPGYTPCDQSQTSCIPTSCADCGKSKLQFQLEAVCSGIEEWSWSIINKEENSVVLNDQFLLQASGYYFDTVLCMDEGQYELTIIDNNKVGFSLCYGASEILNYGNFYKVYVNDRVIAEERQGFSFFIHTKEFQILGPTNMPTSSQPTFTPTSTPSSMPSSLPTAETLTYFIEFEKSLEYSNESLVDGYVFQYKIAKGKTAEQFVARILDNSCVSLYLGKSVYVDDTQIIKDVTREVDKGIISVQFNKTSIEKSDLWTTTSKSSGTLNFCLRAELMFQNISVSYYDVKLKVRFNLLSSSFSQESVNIKLQDSTTFNDEASSEVDACVCEQDHILDLIECIEEPSYYQNSPIQICVSAIAGQKVSKFNNIVFYQNNLPKFKAIENGVENSITIATPGRIGTVHTVLVASLFKGDILHPVTIKGDVLLDFDDSRNLASVPNSVNEEEKNVSFELKINLKKSSLSILSQNGLVLSTLMVFGVLALAIRESRRIFHLRKYALIYDAE